MQKNYKTLKAYRKEFEKKAAVNFYNSFLETVVTFFSGVIGLKQTIEIISETKEISISQAYTEVDELEDLGIIRKIAFGSQKILVARNYLMRNILGHSYSIKNKNYKYQMSKLKFEFIKEYGFMNLADYHINLHRIISYKDILPNNQGIKRSLKGHEIYIVDHKVKESTDLELDTIYYVCFLTSKITQKGILKKIDLLEDISNRILKIHKNYPEGYSKYYVTFFTSTDYSNMSLKTNSSIYMRGSYKFKKIKN